ncbi:segregation/condensation protein A [Candidatus Woesearchaeota archaeon]|nr:segregation/condensation protein A [Candidatus Woesearchaeota archaeon]
MDQKIFDMLLEEEEISWKTILQDLVKREEMDPWDIDITVLTQRYIQVIKEMKEHDLKISGKILLAAAFLLKLKCSNLLEKDFTRLDALMSQTENLDELEDEIFEGNDGEKRVKEKYQLIPRNPQPRNRKVSMNDLIEALQHAMESKKRFLEKIRPVKFKLPERKMDIMEAIRDVYQKLIYYTQKENKTTITFSKLLPPNSGKDEKVYTFVPLLHLENQHRVEMEQKKAFEEIAVTVRARKTKVA